MTSRAFFLMVVAATCLMAQTGARYLIVTHDDYFNAIQPLAEWKQKKGMSCRIVKRSEIAPSATNVQIRNYIINAETAWQPKPEFLLLVGAASKIPAFRHGRGQNQISTDNDYGNITGDRIVELPYGRFPCKSALQCSVMVAKTLAYERTPYVQDSAWFRLGTIAVCDSGDNDGHVYWADARYVAGLAGSAGYWGLDTLSSSRGDDAADIAAAVDGGTSFVLFRGTAGDDWSPPFSVSRILPNLTNGTKLPIVCSFTCQTLSLTGYNDSMTGNTWVKLGTVRNPAGAVAFVGNANSASNVAIPRSCMTCAYFARMFSDSIPYLGHAVLAGKLALIDSVPWDTMDYMGFTLFGDPELNLWTETPVAPELRFDSVIPVCADTFAITVTRAGAPVENALVCVRTRSGAADTIYQYGYSDATGTATLAFTTTHVETLELTVTGRNCLPFEGYVLADTIQGSGVRGERSARIGPIADPGPLTLAVRPSVGQGRFVIAARGATSVRIYNSAGRNVSGSGIESRPYSLVWDAREAPAGLYVVRATGPDGKSCSRTIVVTKQ